MLQSIYFWILMGAVGLFLGIPNPLFHSPFLVLLYPASLYTLAKISKNPFRDGTLCGLLGASFSMYWISVAVHFYGYFPWVLAIPCAMIMGAYIGLWAGVFSFVMRRMLVLDPLLRALSAALFWYICEWVRSFLLTGFSWITLSSAFVPMPEFIQSASIIGAFGLSGVFAGIGVLLVESFTAHIFPEKIKASYTKNTLYKGLVSFGGALLLALLFVYGDVRLASSFKDNDFLYGVNPEQVYTTMENVLASPIKSVDLQKSEKSEKSEKLEESGEYKKYHKNPQNIGPAKHVFVLPNFLGTSFDKDADLIQIEKNIVVPKSFLEQDNIALFTAVQGNVSQAVKWEKPFQLATVQKYIRLSEQGLGFVKNIFPFIDFRDTSALLENGKIMPSIPMDIASIPPTTLATTLKTTPQAQLSSLINPLHAKDLAGDLAEDFTLSIPSVVLWPETALPFDFQRPSPLSAMVWNFAYGQKILFGAPGFDSQLYAKVGISKLYNRLFFLQGDNLSHYDKERLVPFGEYVPAEDFLPEIFSNMLQGVGGFSVGENEELLMLIKSEPMGKIGEIEAIKNMSADNVLQNNASQNNILQESVSQNNVLQNNILQKSDSQESDSQKSVSHALSSLICYEAIFPQIAREDVKNGAELFINISNDAWYDRTSAAEQHLHLSLMRAVEQKRFLVRAGNTGISAFVDDYGRIMAQSDLFTDETLSGFVAFRTEKTIYYRFAPYIPLFAISFFVMLFIYGQIWAIRLQKIRVLK